MKLEIRARQLVLESVRLNEMFNYFTGQHLKKKNDTSNSHTHEYVTNKVTSPMSPLEKSTKNLKLYGRDTVGFYQRKRTEKTTYNYKVQTLSQSVSPTPVKIQKRRELCSVASVRCEHLCEVSRAFARIPEKQLVAQARTRWRRERSYHSDLLLSDNLIRHRDLDGTE